MSALTPDDQKKHELLCAYLLDELGADERREVEIALAESQELAAERDRLAATIGVVQEAFPAEGLSPESLAELMSKATTASPSSIPPGWSFLRGGGGMVRVAAALVVLVGGWFAARSYLDRNPAPEDLDEVARNEPAFDVDGPVDAAEADFVSRPGGEYRGPGDSKPPEDAVEGAVAFNARGAPLREMQETLGQVEHAAGADETTLDFLRTQVLDEAGRALVEGERSEPEALHLVVTDAQPNPTAGGGIEIMAKTVAPTTVAADPAGPTSPGPSSPGPPGTASTRSFKGSTSKDQGGTEIYHLWRAMGTTPPGEAAPDASIDARARAEQRYKEELVEDLTRYAYFGEDRTSRTLEQLESLGYIGHDKNLDADGVAAEEVTLGLEFRDSKELQDLEAGTERDVLLRRAGNRGRGGRRLLLTPQEIDEVADLAIERCRPLAGESPSAMFYRFWGDNPFEPTAVDPQSTFAADVDTASYTLARRYLNDGILPTKQQIRTEEFVNYFSADQPAPVGGAVFDLFTEMAPSLFNADPAVEMLRVTVRGKDVGKVERQPLALTFVIDVSGSMDDGGRLELVKHALGLLVRELDANDSIALIKFSVEAAIVSPMISALNRGPFEDELAKLEADGGTNIEAGLLMGYELASNALTAHAVNRVILLSDGVGNIGETDQERMVAQVETQREKGIYLNTIGVGMGNHNDAFLEQLADKGDGVCNYVDSEKEAEKIMVDDFTKTLQPIARDVKIQVEFDPAQVESYRQLGYENRAIADAEFRDDAVDAGEVNAGHQVTCLYEVKRLPALADTGIPLARVNLRYKPQRPVDVGDASAAGYEWAETATETNRSFFARQAASSFAGTSRGYRRAVLVAQFAEVLRRSVHAADDSFDALVAEATRLNDEGGDPEFAEFCDLLAKARPLLERVPAGQADELTEAMEELRRRQYELNRDAQKLERQLDLGADSFRAETESEWIELGVEAREELTRLEGEVRRLVQSHLAPPAAPEAGEEAADKEKGTVR